MLRRLILVLIVVGLAAAGAYFLYQRLTTPLPEIASQAGNKGFEYRTYGEEKVLTLEAGNLVTANPATPEERLTVLKEFLGQNREFFGVSADVDLDFLPATDEFAFNYEGESYILVSLYQSSAGAPVIDQVNYGGYALNGDSLGELRMVRARLFETAGLPFPPPIDQRLRLRAEQLFREELPLRVTDSDIVTVSEAPVISAGLNIAGYFVWRAANYPDGSTSQLAAVVNPETSQVQELYDRQLDRLETGEEIRP